jgi:hypothetical protein
MKTPWHPPVIVRIGYNIIYATDRFSLGCHAWRQLIETDKTWARLKTHFKAADTDLRLTTTSNSAGFQGAANLVTESTTDAPETALAASQAALATSQAALTAAIQGQANAISHPTNTTPAPTVARSYCWTHGSSRNLRHTSATCNNKADDHQDTATLNNKMGGSEKVWYGARM